MKTIEYETAVIPAYRLYPRVAGPRYHYRTGEAMPKMSVRAAPLTGGSDNFSYANFNWLGYQDSRAVADDSDTARLISGYEQPVGRAEEIEAKYSWWPLSMKLADGSTTVAFKVNKSDAQELVRLSSSADSADSSKIEDILLHKATEVLTTPSASDRMRGVRPSAIVVRTPSSLIDLLDDEVPDLRRGFYPEPQDSRDITPFTGAPQLLMSLLAKLGLTFLFDLISAIWDNLAEEQRQNFDLGTLASRLGRLALNHIPGVALARVIRGIVQGRLTAYLAANPSEDIYDAIVRWVADELADQASLDRAGNMPPSEEISIGKELDWTLGNDQGRYSSDNPSNADLHREHSRDCWYDHHIDNDVACVPLSFWRRLYGMGKSFKQRNAIPNFSKLLLTGSPTADLLLNRVPEIYIYPDGRLSTDYWQYGTYPLAGGLFKKIKNAVKKVGSAVKKVAQGVAKGVSKVMDSPLGNVIKAIPGVGTVASVAHGAAKVITKVTNAIDKVKAKVSGADDSENLLSDAGSDEAQSSALIRDGIVRGEHSDLAMTQPTNGQSKINVAALPSWTLSQEVPYVAPPLSLLTNDPSSVWTPVRIRSVDIPTDLEALKILVRTKLNQVRSWADELDARGPMLMNSIVELRGANLSGDPVAVERGATALRNHRKYWKRHASRGSRRGRCRLAGDPDVDQQLLEISFAKFLPMADWMGVTSLTTYSSTANPFASAYFQMSNESKTAPMFKNSSTGVASLKEFLMNSPICARIKQRELGEWETLAAAVLWAFVIMTAGALSDTQREEIVAGLKGAAVSGLWVGKGVDDMINLILNGKWLSSDQALNKTIAQTWTRMLASGILYIWFEAGADTTNSFTSAIAQVRQPSTEVTRIMGLMRHPASNGAHSQPSAKYNQSAASQQAELRPKQLDSTPEGALTNTLNLMADPFSDEESGMFGDVDTIDSTQVDAPRGYPGDQFSDAAGDYWAMASRICQASLSQESARLQMIANRLPEFIVSMALQRYFPVVSPEHSPASCIPYTRSEYMNFW